MKKEEAGRNYDAVSSIKDNYMQVERSLVEQLYMKHSLHGPTIGTMREEVWESLFEMVIPKKFVIEHSVFIIDSFGKTSREVDLAIMDVMYTPYIFHYGKIKFIPIEAVAVVVECKSKDVNDEIIKEWHEKITKLRTGEGSVTRTLHDISMKAVPTQKSTRPIRVLCTLKENDVKPEIEKLFDFVLYAKEENKEQKSHIDIKTNIDFENLWDWFGDLNFYGKKDEFNKFGIDFKEGIKGIALDNYQIKEADGTINSLLTFNFQLNQLLMLINNPILFPHRKYVEMFNRKENS